MNPCLLFLGVLTSKVITFRFGLQRLFTIPRYIKSDKDQTSNSFKCLCVIMKKTVYLSIFICLPRNILSSCMAAMSNRCVLGGLIVDLS